MEPTSEQEQNFDDLTFPTHRFTSAENEGVQKIIDGILLLVSSKHDISPKLFERTSYLIKNASTTDLYPLVIWLTDFLKASNNQNLTELKPIINLICDKLFKDNSNNEQTNQKTLLLQKEHAKIITMFLKELLKISVNQRENFLPLLTNIQATEFCWRNGRYNLSASFMDIVLNNLELPFISKEIYQFLKTTQILFNNHLNLTFSDNTLECLKNIVEMVVHIGQKDDLKNDDLADRALFKNTISMIFEFTLHHCSEHAEPLVKLYEDLVLIEKDDNNFLNKAGQIQQRKKDTYFLLIAKGEIATLNSDHDTALKNKKSLLNFLERNDFINSLEGVWALNSFAETLSVFANYKEAASSIKKAIEILEQINNKEGKKRHPILWEKSNFELLKELYEHLIDCLRSECSLEELELAQEKLSSLQSCIF